jgi:hypothetical protein
MAKRQNNATAEGDTVAEIISALDGLDDRNAVIRVMRAVANIFEDNWWIETND